MNKFLIVSLVVLGIQLCSAQTLNKNVDCNCRSPVQSRIVDGEILKYPIPFMVSFQYRLNGNWEHQFGGTILNRNWIMTSGRVEIYRNTTFFSERTRVRVGISDLTTPVNSMNTFKIKKIITHDQYNWKKADTFGDISLVELDRPLEFTRTVQPACLSESVEKFTEKSLEAIGFGSYTPFRKGPWGFSLLKPSQINEQNIANKLRHAYFNIDESLDRGCSSENGHLICAKPIMKKNTYTKNSICLGDEGSPLINNKNGYSTVVGLAQYYNRRDDGRYYTYCVENSFFARLSSLIPFIQQTIGNDYCSKN